jgi:hypothetical protein
MFGKIEGGGGSQGRQNRRNIGKERPPSKHSSSKRERSDQRAFPSDNKPKRKKRGPPSEVALQLSDQLKKLSREKKLDEALSVFWDSSNDKIRDGHHACIMVDLTARCGNIAVSRFLSFSLFWQKILKLLYHQNQMSLIQCHYSRFGPPN